LLPELDVKGVAPPIVLPDLSPQQVAALNPAQWQLRYKDGKRYEREAVGKTGKQNEEGRLEVTPGKVEEPAVVSKARITGDFQCRAYLKDVGKDQNFGLIAAGSDPSVLVPLPEGTVKVEFIRKQGVYYCRINDEDVELKPTDKSAAKLTGNLGVTLIPEQTTVIGSFEQGR